MKILRLTSVLVGAIVLLGSPMLKATSPDCIYYIDSNNNVEELRFNGSSWTVTNLMSATSALSARNSSRLTGHLWSSSDNIRYVGTDSHIHELAYYGSPASWHTADVSALANGPLVDDDTPLTSHVNGTSDNVFYADTLTHIHELSFNGSTWTDVDLTSKTGAPNAVITGADNLTGVVNTTVDTEDTFFVGQNGHLNLISLNQRTDTFSTTDLNATAGGFPPATGSTLTSHIYRPSISVNDENVCYVGQNGDLSALQNAWNGSSYVWYTLDITLNDPGSKVPGSGTSPLAGYENGSYDDIYFITSTPGVYLDSYTGSAWSYTNVTSLAGGSAPDPSRAMVGHMWQNNTPEVHCFLSNGDVYEYYYSSGWYAGDLTSKTGAPAAKSASPIVAFTGI